MHRQPLLRQLNLYRPQYHAEVTFKTDFIRFVKKHPNCFERSLLQGHVTGSAWIVNRNMDRALLTYHKKLQRWLQLGGHADGETDIISVCHKEAQEESGLDSLQLVSDAIFDIDIHTIPQRKNTPEHLHYDVRFLFEADDQKPLTMSDESRDLRWVRWDDLKQYTENNISILRMAEKTALLRGNK